MNKNNTTKSNQKDQRLIDAKISLLQLAEELGNIQKACKATGIARSSFYEIKRAYEKFGRGGLASSRKGRKMGHINTTALSPVRALNKLLKARLLFKM